MCVCVCVRVCVCDCKGVFHTCGDVSNVILWCKGVCSGGGI